MNDDLKMVTISCIGVDPGNALFLDELAPIIECQSGVMSTKLVKETLPNTKGELSAALQIVFAVSSIAIPVLYDIIKAVWSKNRRKKNELSLTLTDDRKNSEVITLMYDDTKNTVMLTVKKDDSIL